MLTQPGRLMVGVVRIAMVVHEALETYHENPALGSSMVKTLIEESPKHFKAKYIDKIVERKETKSLKFGSAIHLAILEPMEFAKRFAVEPDLRRNTNAYKDWLAAQSPDAVVISGDDMLNLNGMINAIKEHKDASKMLERGIPERSIYQARDGINIKARPDFLHENGDVIDFKSTIDCAFGEFRNQAYRLNYHVSAAMYLDVVELEFGKLTDRNFWFIAQEKIAPWDVSVFRANEIFMGRGDVQYKKGLWLYKTCLETGVWPGKQSAAEDLDCPPWSENE